MIKKLRENNGSLTIETTIVFTTTFFVIIIIMYLCMLLYQQACISSIANDAVEKGAVMWVNPYKDMFMQKIEKKDMRDTMPYWRLIDTNEDRKKDIIKQYVIYEVERKSILGAGRKCNPTVEIKKAVFDKKLVVQIEHNYKMPFGSLLNRFGIGNEFVIGSRAEAVISEPAEYIRSTDMLVDVSNQIDKGVEKRLGVKLSDTVLSSMRKLFDKLSSFVY